MFEMNIGRSTVYRGFRAFADAYWSLLFTTLRFIKLALAGKLLTLPMRAITDEFAFSLSPEGWNYYRALLAEYDQLHDDTPPQQTAFYRFFQHERINDLRYLDDILHLHEPTNRFSKKSFRFYLGTYPWGGLTEVDSRVGGTPFGWYYDQKEGKMTRDLWGYRKTLWYRPAERYTLDLEWNSTIHTLSVLKEGYRPLRYGSIPSVTLLVRRDGRRRAVIGDGHHRLSALAHLGFDRVAVEVTQVVNEAQVDTWYYVRGGQCPKDLALNIFHAFFSINGRERFDYLNV